MERDRGQRGAALLSFVLILSALAGAGMLRDLEARAARDMEARARAAGALFAQWFRATHHLAQSEEAHYRTLVAAQGSAPVRPAELRRTGLVPPWMPERTDAGQTLTLGVIDDGRGVPMAFALATSTEALSPLYREGFVAGAAANRAGDVAGPGREARATRWQGAIERALGRPLERGELYATADAGIAHDRRVVYRREQPGRAGQSRMETSLAFGDGAGISDVGALDALRAEVADRLSAGTLQTGGGLAARSARVEGDLHARHAEGQGVTVRAALGASHWGTGTLEARRLGVDAELAAHGVKATGEVGAPGELVIDRGFEAQRVRSAKAMSERVEAWGAPGTLAASGGVEAHYSVGERAVFNGTVTVTGECMGC